MSEILKISSGTIWENQVGYSRAIRVGNVIEVSGTTAISEDQIIGIGNMYEQTIFIFEKVEKALKLADASLENVVRTRMFVTDISKWEEAGKAHHHFFKHIKPASSMYQIQQLIHPDLLIEIEVTAIM